MAANFINTSGNIIANSGIFSILTANSGYLDRLIFNTTLDDPNLTAGQLQWNSTEGTLDLGFTDTYTQHMGEELHYRVRNNTASTLVKGTAVYASGLTPGGNNRIEIAPFTADGSVREVRFMGLVTENISNGVNGYTTQFGYIRGIDTRGDATSNGTTNKLWATGEPSWAEGDILYAHPSVPGKLTKVEPKHSISVAIILNRHQNQGKIFVRSTSYGHLDDNHDVNVSGVTNGQFLQYSSATDYWVPSSSGNFTTLQVNGTGVSVSGHSHTSSDITNFNSSVSGLLPTVANSGDNRVLTSTGSSVGINAEANLTFDGSLLNVTGSGSFSSNLNLSSQTVNTIAGFDGSKNIVSLPTSTYPSFTELSYVKGVTSSIQTQLNGKAPTASPAFTASGSASAVVATFLQSGLTTGNFNQIYVGRSAAGNDCGTLTFSPNATAANSTLALGIFGASFALTLDGNSKATFGGQLLVTAGSASACGVAFSGDTNTGMFSPGADQLAFSTNQTERVRIDASGNVGIGVAPAASTTSRIQCEADITLYGGSRAFLGNLYFQSGWKYAGTGYGWGWVDSGSGNISFLNTTASGNAGDSASTLAASLVINASRQLLVTAGSGSAGSYKPGIAVSGDDDTGLQQVGGANTISLVTNGSERLQINADGNAIFTRAGEYALVMRRTDTGVTNNFISAIAYDAKNASGTYHSYCRLITQQTDATAGTESGQFYVQVRNNGTERSYVLIDGESDTVKLLTGGAERLVVGSSNRTFVNGNGEQYGFGVRYVNTGGPVYFGATSSSATPDAAISNAGGGTLLLAKNSGEILIGQTATTDPAGVNTNGVAIGTDYISVSRSSFECLRLNIKAADGTIVALFQDAALEGSISVSGNTVSYNAFCGSHWAQLIDGSRPAILRGTVLETIDEMCEWPEGKSDRLARVKVSDTPRSRRVYGVFMGWDEQYAATGDMYATALGAYMVRVSGDVQSGDLLESAGDGTARAQSDDIVRSSTIGKVSSTHRVAEYDDGSYLVPCVLMCG